MGRLRKNTTRVRRTGWLQRLSKHGKIAVEGIFRTSSTVSHYPTKGVVMMTTMEIFTFVLVLIAFADLIISICKKK